MPDLDLPTSQGNPLATVAGFRCEVAESLHRDLTESEIEAAVRGIVAGCAGGTRLRERPNRIDQILLGSTPGVAVVVKSFSSTGWRAQLDLRIRGTTRAERCWRTANLLTRHGILTPEPLLVIVANGRGADAASYYVSRFLPGSVETRRLVDGLNADRPAPELEGLDVERTVRRVGRVARELHEVGIWHRDLTSGNLLIWPWPSAEPGIYLIDLDRSRVGIRIGATVRARELGRFPVFRAEHREALLAGYYDPDPVPALDRFLYRVHHRSYHFRKRVRVKTKKGLARLLR